MDVTASAGAKGGREGSRHVEEKEGGREAWTVVPMPRTRCGEARHREAGADGAEERETEAREGQGMLMREAEEREAEERVEQRILLPFLFVRSESMPRFTTSCLRTSYSCDISPIGTIVGSATAAF